MIRNDYRGDNRIRRLSTCLIMVALSLLLSGCDAGRKMERAASRVYNLFNADGTEASEAKEADIASDIASGIASDSSGMPKEDVDLLAVMDEDDDSSFEKIESNNEDVTSSIPVYGLGGDLLVTEIAVIDEPVQNTNDEPEVKASDFENTKDQSGYYGYSMLDDEHKAIYEEIYSVLDNMLEEVTLSSKDTEKIDLAFRTVMMDHPEIFYVKGYSIGKYMIAGNTDRITLSGTYTYTKDQVDNKKPEIEEYVNRVLSGLPSGDDYNKIRYIYEYLINNNEYVEDSRDNQNILSVVENGKTVCQGYAKMTQLLLNRSGIFCTLVNGKASGSSQSAGRGSFGSHVWNIVKCNGRYYNLDTTWGDAAFNLVDTYNGQAPTIDINYEFFLVDDNSIKDTHRPEPVVEMPVCNSLDDNYYVREGCYFTYVDTAKLSSVFSKAYANGDSLVFLKAADSATYSELKKHILDEQGIFDYVSQSNVKFVEYPARNLILISL